VGAAVPATLLGAFGSRTGTADFLIAAFGGAVVSVILMPMGELAYNWLRTPLRVANERITVLEGENVDLRGRIEDLQAAPKPHLKFVGIDIDRDAQLFRRVVRGGVDRGIVPVDGPQSWARVLIANDPGDEPGARAERVVAWNTFFDYMSNVELLTVEARWAEAPQAPEIQRIGLSKEGRELDIDGNGDAHPLDIAMKFDSDNECFAYNNENGQLPDGKLEKHLLRGERFYVRVRVKGGNTPPQVGWYMLENLGANQPLTLAPSGPPPQRA
jgi:hypothetical protein